MVLFWENINIHTKKDTKILKYSFASKNHLNHLMYALDNQSLLLKLEHELHSNLNIRKYNLHCLHFITWNKKSVHMLDVYINKPAAQAAGADPFRCNYTNRQNLPRQ